MLATVLVGFRHIKLLSVFPVAFTTAGFLGLKGRWQWLQALLALDSGICTEKMA